MNQMWTALTIMGSVALAGCSGEAPNPAQLDQSKVGDTDTLAFSAAAETTEIEQGLQSFKLTVTVPGSMTPMPGLTITVTPSMPSMGMTTKGATVTEVGGGVYEVKDVDFSMGGDWFVKYQASMPDMEDTVTFQYGVP